MEPEVGPSSTADADQKDNATREKGGENVESRRKSSSSNKGVFGRRNEGEGIFVSIKSINISGSDPDLRRGSSSTPTENNFLLRGSFTSDRDKISRQFNIPDIKSETTVFIPRVCSDSHIGEGEGFHSSRLSSSASHGSLSSALLVVGITSSGTNANASKKLSSIPSEGCDSESLVNKEKVGEKEEDEEDEETDKTIGQDVEVFSGGESGDPNRNTPPEKVVVEDLDVFLESVSVGGCGEDVEEGDLLSIQGLHDISVANTEDFVDDEELLEEYDEPDDGLSREIEKAFESEELVEISEQSSRRRIRGVVVPCPISKYKDSATWTQEDDMPSPLSDLSPIQSPRKASVGGNKSSRGGNGGVGVGGGGGHQFDHQYQYHHPSQGYLRESRDRHSHQQTGGGGGSSSRNSRSHHRTSRGIHQSQSNQRVSVAGGGSGVVGEFIHHQPQQHHQPTECFTVSSQLLSREARLYENVPTTPGELETLEILLGGEAGGASNYPPSGGSAGASSTSKGSSSHTSNKTHSSSSGKNNCGSVGGGRESSGSSGTSNHHHQHHQHPHHQHHHNLLLGHHHSANNLNLLVPSPTATANSVEQLFSVSELLGCPGSCLAVGGGGPPSRTSWVDSGRESLSFDGENNNSGGSTRNLLLIPPPPPPPINYQTGFVPIPSGIIMQAQKHHHHHHHQQQQLLQQSPSHSQGSSRKNGGERASRRERLVRQKQAIDETFLPIPTNSDLTLGMEQGGNCGTGTGYLAVPSPRRGVIPGNIIASNFIAAAASPISLQRHPPPSQIMLQENKKNRALIPCESPYGIMSGGGLGLVGTGNGGTGDWTYSRSDKKGSQLTRDLLRCRSPQRGRSGRSKGHNQSFDYGELPSHQMFPKRHLLTSRQLSSHPQQGGPYPQDLTVGTNSTTSNGANGSNPNGSTNSPFLLHPNNHHRSFPAGLFSGMTPKSCSMGDLTSSTASPNNQASSNNHNYQSYHGNGKPSDQSGICSNTTPAGGMQSSTVPLVTSLPLPPATSVTYEFSLAPQSGTLAPGWHLTAVQRGLATAVPLAAAVARRRLPRPRTTRPRFGFTDKNEARRAKWTIAVTALALLAMSMLLVGITLRLAPLIDDLGPNGYLRPEKGSLNSYRGRSSSMEQRDMERISAMTHLSRRANEY